MKDVRPQTITEDITDAIDIWLLNQNDYRMAYEHIEALADAIVRHLDFVHEITLGEA